MNFNRNLVSITIDKLYSYSNQQNITLFPTEDYDFWQGYEANYAKFDRYFFQKFRAFKICQEYSSSMDIADILSDWKAIIDAFLFLNAKRYSELYRVQVLANDAYDVVNNYDVTETYQRANTGTVKDNIGGRSDSTLYGQVQVTKQNGATSESLTYGAVSESDVHGAQSTTDNFGAKSGSDSYGAVSTTINNGAHTDSNSSSLGAQQSSNTEQIATFNSGLENVRGGTINNGSRADSSSVTYGAQSNSESTAAHSDSHTEAARSDTHSAQSYTDSHTEQARTDGRSTTAYTDTDTTASHTDSLTQGAQENIRTDNLQENSTMRRYGNIGVQTPADVIGGHIDLWKAFKFYQMIFDEIAEEYLVIDVDFDFETSSYSGSGGGDAELLSAIRQLSQQLTNATSSINGNVDSAELVIRSDIAAAKSSINNNIDDAETNIRSDISSARTAIVNNTDAAEQAIRGDISTGITTINANVNAAAGVVRGDISAVRTAVTTFGAANLSATAEVKQAVVTFGSSIKSDIYEVTTNGY